MKRAIAAVLTCLAAFAAEAATPVAYKFGEVRRTVVLTTASEQKQAQAGLGAQSGDRVHTGWWSYAMIAAEAHRAQFEIFSSTDVELASGTPGVLLSVERGRIRALFDKITGSEPRVVQTPGALLAVRGTKFDVEVSKSGQTTVDVFEGVVEVQSPLRPEPLFVRAGQQTIFTRREPPTAHPMPEDRMRNAPGREREGGHQQDPNAQPRQPGMRPGDGMQQPRDGMGGTPGRPSTAPPPPPGHGHGGE